MSLKLELDNWVLSRLAEPFDPEDVKWLPAFGSGNSGALAYVDARTVTNRLNEVVGAENWQDSYIESTIVHTEIKDVTDYDALIESDRATKKGYKTVLKSEKDRDIKYNDLRYGGIRCNLTVLGVTKSDVGVPSFAEQLKGAYSDSLKRAAVKFGIGEYFYRLGTLTAKVEYGRVVVPPELPDWALPMERPSPDPVIQEAIAKLMATSLRPNLTIWANDVLRSINVMGNYNTYAPLVVKRAVYEDIQRILAAANSEEETSSAE